MIDKNEALKIACEIMERSEEIYVSTLDEEGLPQIRVMFNLRNNEKFSDLAAIFENHSRDLLMYLGTNTSSAKIKQIINNPAISICFSIPSGFESLMISGKAEIITDMEIKNRIWQNGWEIYYPLGPGDPDYTILRLLPVKGKGWYKDQPYEFRIGKA